MGEEDANSFFVQLEQLTERLKHRRLAEVFRTISFHASETYGPHAHLRIEINYVKRGSCILHLEDESVLFREGDIMIILSNVPHTFEAGQQGTTLLQLEFLPEIFSMFGPHDRFGSFSVFTRENRLIRICNHIRMMRVIQRIINELNGRAEYFQNLVVLYYAELLLLIYRHLDEIYVPMGANEALRRFSSRCAFYQYKDRRFARDRLQKRTIHFSQRVCQSRPFPGRAGSESFCSP